MLLTGEVKDKGYNELPRQQEALYAKSSDVFMKADAQTGKHYYDLNAASKSYSGPWLFGKEHVQVYVRNLKAEWMQWCPIPADLPDGVLVKGNVLYDSPAGGYRMSSDQFEGVVRTEPGGKYFYGKTQHTFLGRQFPGGEFRVVADLRIFLNQRLPYNPMMFGTKQTERPNFDAHPAYAQQSQPTYPQYQQSPQYPQQYAPQGPAYQPQTPEQQFTEQPSYAPQQQRFQDNYTQPNTAPRGGSRDDGF